MNRVKDFWFLVRASLVQRIILMVLPAFLMTELKAVTVNCYPQYANYWTGSCLSSFKTQSSLIYAQGGGYYEQGWMKFDISQIPLGATVTSIKIHYYINALHWPYYRFTKVTADPVTATSSVLYNQITTGTVYYQYTGLTQYSWNVRTLGSTSMTDLQNCISQGWFVVGLYEYESSSTWYLHVDGWNQVNKPYLEVEYTPTLSNDLGVDSLTQPLNYQCQGQHQVTAKIKNFGINSITSATVDWSVGGVFQGSILWVGSLASGQAAYVTLGNFTYPPGINSINIVVSNPNGVSDPNPLNNNKTFNVTLNPIASILTHPVDVSALPGSTVTFTVNATAGNQYQWQLSINGGLTYSNLINVPPFMNVQTSVLSITGVLQSMNGYMFRCVVSGVCPPPAITNTAILFVGDPVKTRAGTAFACPGNQVAIPVMVKNLNLAIDFTLTLNYNATQLTYLSYSDLNPLLASGTFGMLITGNSLKMTWSGPAPVTIAGEDTLCLLRFTYLNGSSNLIWDTITSGNCQYHGNSGITYAAHYYNGLAYSGIPVINTQPYNTTVNPGSSALFWITTTGVAAYQWQLSADGGSNWSNLSNNSYYSGVTNDTLLISNTLLVMNNYKYRCLVNGCAINLTSNAATLNVIKVVTTWIDSVASCFGNQVVLPVRVFGFDSIGSVSLTLFYDKTSISYIGYQNLYPTVSNLLINNIGSANPAYIRIASYQISNISIPNNQVMVELKFNYTGDSSMLQWDTWTAGACQYTDVNNNVLPTIFRRGLVWHGGPYITAHPANLTTQVGDTAVFTVAAFGRGPAVLAYQWELSVNGGTSWSPLTNGGIYSGVTSAMLKINGVTHSMNTYTYRCNVSGLCTPVQVSNAATLTVNLPPVTCLLPAGQVACIGDTVLVPINIINFRDGEVCSFSMKISFDDTRLQYLGYTNLNSTFSTNGTYTVTLIGNNIIVNWLAFASVFYSGMKMADLKFMVLAQGSSAFTWLSNPPNTNCVFMTCLGDYIPSIWVNGNISLNPLPVAFSFFADPVHAHFCPGSSGINLKTSGSEVTATYSLLRNGNPVAGYGNIPGSSGSLSIGPFLVPGSYRLQGTMNSSGCMQYMDGTVIIVADTIPQIFNLGGGGVYCSAYCTGLNITIGGSQSSYSYSLLNGSTPLDTLVGTGSSLSFGPFPAGSYSVIASNITGTCTRIMHDTVQVIEAPCVSVDPVSPVCAGSNIQLTSGNGAYSSFFQYSWSGPSGFSSTLQNPVIPNAGTNQSGIYTVTATANGCPSTASVMVTVNAPPAVTLAPFANVCLDAAPFMLSGGLPAGGTYSGTGISANIFHPSVAGQGTFNITYTLTDLNGCTNSSSANLTVVSMPKIMGMARYDNPPINTPMANVKVYLKNALNIVIDSAITGVGTAIYMLRCLTNGTYTLSAKTNRPFGQAQVNSLDALMIAQSSVGLLNLSQFRKRAGDVNLSNTTNSADALMVMRRYVGQISSFPAGDWVFDVNNPAVITGTSLTRDVLFLCTGDVNGSHLPSVSKPGTKISLVPDADINCNHDDCIPFILKKDLQCSALSLILFLDGPPVADVLSPLPELLWGYYDGELRLAWFSLDPVVMRKGIPLFTVILADDNGMVPVITGVEAELSGSGADTVPLLELLVPRRVKP